jgi:uncharacterized membrane protein HdeD (DUF308 family)
VLLVIVGAIVLLYPSASLVMLTSLLGVVLVVDGALLVIRGFSARRSTASAQTAGGPPWSTSGTGRTGSDESPARQP